MPKMGHIALRKSHLEQYMMEIAQLVMIEEELILRTENHDFIWSRWICRNSIEIEAFRAMRKFVSLDGNRDNFIDEKPVQRINKWQKETGRSAIGDGPGENSVRDLLRPMLGG